MELLCIYLVLKIKSIVMPRRKHILWFIKASACLFHICLCVHLHVCKI